MLGLKLNHVSKRGHWTWASHCFDADVITSPCLTANTDLVKTLRPRQNGRQFPDLIFKWIFLNENVWIVIKVSLKFVSNGLMNNIPALVQIMAWRRPGDKPLSKPMMVNLRTHICVTQTQWYARRWYVRCRAPLRRNLIHLAGHYKPINFVFWQLRRPRY